MTIHFIVEESQPFFLTSLFSGLLFASLSAFGGPVVALGCSATASAITESLPEESMESSSPRFRWSGPVLPWPHYKHKHWKYSSRWPSPLLPGPGLLRDCPSRPRQTGPAIA